MSSKNDQIDENIFTGINETISTETETLELETPPPSPSDKKCEKPGFVIFLKNVCLNKKNFFICFKNFSLFKSIINKFYFLVFNYRLFSLAQVSLKLNELWSSARERVFGEDYWIPSDPYEVAFFPQELLSTHKIVYPLVSNEKCATNSHLSLMVIKGCIKNEPFTAIYHVIYAFNSESHRETLSIFRSTEMAEAIDFCRRCEESRVLLRLLGFVFIIIV